MYLWFGEVYMICLQHLSYQKAFLSLSLTGSDIFSADVVQALVFPLNI